MHELSIAQYLVELLENESKSQQWDKIMSVYLKIGYLRQIIPDVLEFAFEASSLGTKAEGAHLVIEIAPLELLCNICGEITAADKDFIVCSNCGSSSVKIIHGNELDLTGLEVE